jgi:hypothetical protein
MAYQNRRNRGAYPWQPQVVFNIPPGGKVLDGMLILAGTVTIAGGTTNGTVIGEGGPVNLIKKIKITATRGTGSRYPNGELVNNTPRALLRYAITQHGGKYIGELSGSTLGNGAVGTYVIYLAIPIYWADSTLRNEVQTALNMDPVDSTGVPVYENVQVKVDLATDLTTCFSGSDRVANFSGLSVQWDDTRLNLGFDTTPIVQEDHDFLIQAAQTRAVDYAFPTDGAITSLFINAESGVYKTLSDTLLNKLTMAAPTLNLEEYALDIRSRMYTDEWFDASQSGIGQFYIDFTNGLLQNSNPASGIAMEFDVNNPSGASQDQLKIYTRRFFGLSS